MYAKKQLIFTVLGFFLFFFIGWKGAEYTILNDPRVNISSPDSHFETLNPRAVDLDLYWDVWNRLETSYLDITKIQNDRDLVYGSIKGMVGSLEDPYTVFMTPNETKEFNNSLNGSLEGIGTELIVEDGFLVILSPIKNSPAEAAGILPGDIIYQIDGDNTGDMSLYEAMMNIRGKKGTDVTLTIVRFDVAEPFDVIITRDEINIESVTYEVLEGDIAYVAINQFSDNTAEEFDKAVQDMLLNEPKGLIIDLRYNGGGYLDIAVDILSEFIKGKKAAVQIATRLSDENDVIDVWDTARLPEVPLVVLVNYGSASASEILAGAIQDHKRGLVMGEETYGKGSVQEVEALEDGSSLRLTIAKWLTPEGRDIDEVGITPDRIIEYDFEYEGELDNQLEEAYNYLLNL